MQSHRDLTTHTALMHILIIIIHGGRLVSSGVLVSIVRFS